MLAVYREDPPALTEAAKAACTTTESPRQLREVPLGKSQNSIRANMKLHVHVSLHVGSSAIIRDATPTTEMTPHHNDPPPPLALLPKMGLPY